MWVFTPEAFFSAVQKYGTDFITVRARVQGDLDKLRKYMPGLGPEQKGGGTDYPFRATVSKADFKEGMAKLADTVDYDNFKSETARVSGHDRAHIYHEVWDVHYSMTKRLAKPKTASKSKSMF